MSSIPTPESITADWLSQRLHEAGHRGVTVRDFRATRIGTGQIGRCVRYELELDAESDEARDTAPRSLVGKFPSDNETSRATGVALKSYIKEVSFYRDMQIRIRIASPRCYFAEIVDAGPEFCLLLEDLAPAEQGDQLRGCDAETASAAVLELVGLHAPSWNAEDLRRHAWLDEPSADRAAMLSALYGTLLDGCIERIGSGLEQDEIEIIRAVAESKAIFSPGLPEPYALVHSDYRLDNLLIDSRTSPPRITAVDWQTLTLSSPLADVAYFLGAGLLPDVRAEVEKDIVRAYHAALLAAGVRDYAWDRCWTDYRRGTFAGFLVTVLATMLVQQTERGDAMFTVMAKRHARHALDLGSREFL